MYSSLKIVKEKLTLLKVWSNIRATDTNKKTGNYRHNRTPRITNPKSKTSLTIYYSTNFLLLVHQYTHTYTSLYQTKPLSDHIVQLQVVTYNSFLRTKLQIHFFTYYHFLLSYLPSVLEYRFGKTMRVRPTRLSEKIPNISITARFGSWSKLLVF